MDTVKERYRYFECIVSLSLVIRQWYSKCVGVIAIHVVTNLFVCRKLKVLGKSSRSTRKWRSDSILHRYIIFESWVSCRIESFLGAISRVSWEALVTGQSALDPLINEIGLRIVFQRHLAWGIAVSKRLYSQSSCLLDVLKPTKNLGT